MADKKEPVVEATTETWSEAFAPRDDLEAASTTPTLKRGSLGRRQLQAQAGEVKSKQNLGSDK